MQEIVGFEKSCQKSNEGFQYKVMILLGRI